MSMSPSLVKWAFQSTLPRGERLLVRCCTRQGLLISIHAPAWGATAKMHKFYAFLDKITIFRELNGDFAWF